ncbi:MAG: adenylate kinase [Gammaproteobacteria bacterium]|jgi:adenylate kinase family enzyme|nr:adenylate kinase [Gammaproteobacteria bacterium]
MAELRSAPNSGALPISAGALRRIHVMGNSSAGKSTLGKRLAGSLGVPFVELDALNWLPNWVGLNATDPDELERRMREATAGDGWVVAGSYTAFSQRAFWDRLQVVIWLDLPRHRLLWRLLRRSWRRWRTRELLWGTNYESFWAHFYVWRKSESLIWWIWTQHARKRRDMLRMMADPRWSHVRFIRLVSPREIEAFTGLLERDVSR